jgi:hypothetical protein
MRSSVQDKHLLQAWCMHGMSCGGTEPPHSARHHAAQTIRVRSCLLNWWLRKRCSLSQDAQGTVVMLAAYALLHAVGCLQDTCTSQRSQDACEQFRVVPRSRGLSVNANPAKLITEAAAACPL